MFFIFYTTSAILLEIEFITAVEKNVCRTYADYNFWGDGCYYNPDVDEEVPQIIARRGYEVEEHSVITPDGYKLGLFRIPNKNGTPVLILHGGTTSSMGFVNNGNISIVYELAADGFDVWLGNYRGVRYSKGHISLSTNSSRYWTFSFHENGIYDLRTTIDYIYSTTENKRMVLIAHSMASMTTTVYLSEFPQESSARIKLIVHFAPTVFVTQDKSITVTLLGLADLIGKITGTEFEGVLFERRPDLYKSFKFCFGSPIRLKLCNVAMQLGSGVDIQQYNPETIPIFLVQNHDAISYKTLAHFRQVIRTGRFAYFDYGYFKNKKLYNQSLPPLYNFAKIKVPQHVIYGLNDLMATQKNVLKFYCSLPKEVQFGTYEVPYKLFTHDDFVKAKDLKVLLNNHVLSFIRRFQSRLNHV